MANLRKDEGKGSNSEAKGFNAYPPVYRFTAKLSQPASSFAPINWYVTGRK
jgi:hypothetical protein